MLLAGALACGETASDDSSIDGGAATGGTANGGSAGMGGMSAMGGMAGMGGMSAIGGMAGMGATGGSSGSTNAECTSAAECKLFADCCTCSAYGPNEPPPPSCFSVCEVDACTALGLPANHPPACEVGQCIAGFDCDINHAACESLPPSCGPGTTVSVVNGCWGGCVPPRECLSVTGCESCAPGELCVNQNQTGNEYHCVAFPAECAGNPTTQCLCPLF